MRDVGVPFMSGQPSSVPGGDVLFGEAVFSDINDMEVVAQELVQEAEEQPWDTNSYFVTVNAETASAVAVIGSPIEVHRFVAETMKRYFESVSFTYYYMEGFMPKFSEERGIAEAYELMVEKVGEKTEFKMLLLVADGFARFYLRFRDEDGWRTVAEGDDCYDPYSPYGKAMIDMRKEMGL